jgi:isoamylase
VQQEQVFPGHPYPLGATYDGDGTNFALFAHHASKVELCLFNEGGEVRITMPERTHQIWHGYIPGIAPGQAYGYRVYGEYNPEEGHRYNPNKLLLDPYAKEVAGNLQWDDSVFGYVIGSPSEDLEMSTTDSAGFVPKSVVVGQAFDWQGDKLPRIPLHQTIIYEAHVKGLTFRYPGVNEHCRGTYAGLATDGMIAYLKELGITSVELMPVHVSIADRHLVENSLTNYWGYNSISFFAPDPRFACSKEPGGPVREFKEMVRKLHEHNIEVILDVVYNHTAEGNQAGPTFSFKGIDNKTYYRLAESPRFYKDFTGTGNTLDATQPHVLQLIMDSLRYWINEMHVDGFRFDLAATLARDLHAVNMLSAFFGIIQQDPVISQVKLIAEPWDVGEGGYQVGKFPPGWLEWNGKYRDCIRDFWRGEESLIGEFALRITGSPDLYEGDLRRPTASINIITAHDGFTLHDLVSYNEKHNEANLEGNRDGESHNRSWNCGVEGETDDPAVIALRQRQKRNLLTTLFLSQGIPMLVAGDEIGKTQKGNNNAYCQDNELSWLDWENADKELLAFVRKLIAFRKAHPVFCRRKWFQGEAVTKRGLEDIKWFRPQGDEMSDEDWQTAFARSLAVFFNGKGIHPRDTRGQIITDDSFYAIFNAHSESVGFVLPPTEYAKNWIVQIDTNQPCSESQTFAAGSILTAAPFSVTVLLATNE